MLNLGAHIFSVIGHAAIRNVKLPFPVITEHGAITVFPDEVEICRLICRTAARNSTKADIIMHLTEVHIIPACKTCDQVLLQILIGERLLAMV